MLTSAEHKKVFFDFVKNHDEMIHIKYVDESIQDQQIIGLMVPGIPGEDDVIFLPYVEELLKEENTILIDPDYDQLYESFLGLDHNLESVEYMQQLVETDTSRERVSQLVIDLIIKPLIALNIDAKKVYFRIKPHWITDWCDQVIEVE
jgi:hypothetical protein